MKLELTINSGCSFKQVCPGELFRLSNGTIRMKEDDFTEEGAFVVDLEDGMRELIHDGEIVHLIAAKVVPLE